MRGGVPCIASAGEGADCPAEPARETRGIGRYMRRRVGPPRRGRSRTAGGGAPGTRRTIS